MTIAFIESPRFPDAISFGATGGATYLTTVYAVASGAEYRNQNWMQTRAAYEVSHAARLPAEYKALQAFFRAVKGRLVGFRFKDWADYTVESGEGVFVELDSTSSGLQLAKRYTAGTESDAPTDDRIIRKPVSGTVQFVGSGSYTLDYTTGIVTVTSGSDPTGWTGEFDVPCRFDTDSMRGTIIDKAGNDLIIGWDSIPIVEVRV